MAPSNHKMKLFLHASAFCLAGAAVVLGLIMMFNPVMLGGAKRTPMASRVGLSMGAKSLIFILYQVLTENLRSFKRWASTKANLILNCIETVAWPAACGVTVYGILQFCIGISCTMSWILVPVTAVLAIISAATCWISFKEHRDFKRTGVKPGDMRLQTMDSENSNKAFNAGNGVALHQTPITRPQHATYRY